MTIDPPKVFVSYAHESEEHKALVLAFATFLRNVGVEAVLDRWAEDARRDWSAWAIREMTGADFVLVIASVRYRQSGDGHSPTSDNRGVQSEAALLREFVHGDRVTWLPKILPVLLPGHGVDEIPLFLQPHSASRYPVRSFDVAGADELLRVLLRQPRHPAPEVASERQALPPHSPASFPPPEGSTPGRVVNQVNGNVTGNVVQADTIKGDITFR
jgi:SEFIR domain-containing protein